MNPGITFQLYLLEAVVFAFVVVSVPSLFYALQKLLKRRLFHKGLVIIIYFNVFTGYFDISEDIYKSGVHHEYYEDGQLKSEGPYLGGLRHGRHLYYFPDGKVAAEKQFRFHVLHGVSQWYYPSGVLKGTVTFRDGQRHGLARTYIESGLLGQEMIFRHGRLLSRRVYDEMGQPLYEKETP